MRCASLLALSVLPLVARALPCVSFDNDWNLYAFGVQGQYSWALGTQDTWSSASGAYPGISVSTETGFRADTPPAPQAPK